jgi:hypothetical protein
LSKTQQIRWERKFNETYSSHEDIF